MCVLPPTLAVTNKRNGYVSSMDKPVSRLPGNGEIGVIPVDVVYCT